MEVSLAAKLEAILYLKGRPLRLNELAVYAQCTKREAGDALIDLMETYSERDSALEISESKEGYLLQLKPALKELVHTLVPVDLGVGVLRSLAAVALKNGLTLSELVDLRGSGAYQHVQKLVAEGFVQKRQHKDSRSAKLRITDKFHQYFQIDQLPEIKPPKLAPEAVQLKLEEAIEEEEYEAEIEALESPSLEEKNTEKEANTADLEQTARPEDDALTEQLVKPDEPAIGESVHGEQERPQPLLQGVPDTDPVSENTDFPENLS